MKPLTDTTPKCLLPVNGRPLLDYWFELFKKNHIKKILMNTSEYNKQAVDYIYTAKPDVNITFVYEKKMLGTAGTIYSNKSYILGEKEQFTARPSSRKFIKRNENSFLVIYADNFTDMNIQRMIDYHCKRLPLATIGLFRTDNPKECGIVDMDDTHIITNFEEKPEKPKSNLAFAGIMVVSKQVFHYMNPYMKDIGHDLLPILVATRRIYGYEIRETYIDIGTPKGYEKANEEAEKMLTDSTVHKG